MRTFLVVSLLLFVCVLDESSRVSAIDPQYCYNELDDSFLNRCRIHADGFWTILANYVIQFVNPRTLAITTLSAILVLPIFFLANVNYGKDSVSLHVNKNQMNLVRFKLINFLHRICYSLVLDVALYAVFRQSRPCRCIIGGSMTHIGSIYGMPSGDAMAGALLAAFLFEEAPFHKISARIVSVVLVMLVCMERVVLGYHTIGQVTVGASLGILLHIYSTRAPQFCIFIDAVVQFILGCITLNIDPALVYTKGDPNNLFSWFLWGVSIQVFVCLMAGRYFWQYRQTSTIQRNLAMNSQSHLELDGEEFQSLSDANLRRSVNSHDDKDEDAAGPSADRAHFREHSDMAFSLWAFGALSVVNILSLCVQSFGILSKQVS